MGTEETEEPYGNWIVGNERETQVSGITLKDKGLNKVDNGFSKKGFLCCPRRELHTVLISGTSVSTML